MLRRVVEEHPAAGGALLDDVAGRDVEHARLGGHDDAAVAGHPVAAGPSPFRSSVAPIRMPSVNASDAGPSQGSMRHEWYS